MIQKKNENKLTTFYFTLVVPQNVKSGSVPDTRTTNLSIYDILIGIWREKDKNFAHGYTG